MILHYSGKSAFLPLLLNFLLELIKSESGGRGVRHEIAFVFGQLSSPDSVPSLIDVLGREKEEDMVRHEAAEALGGIATDECFPILQEYAKRMDVPRVVRESCEVALDMVSRSCQRFERL